MRKVIAVGETIMDIIFKGERPTAAVPGGSSFNSIVSIGRAGVSAVFMGETGDDEVGRRIASFLKAAHVDTRYLRTRADIQSAVSLAFLDERSDAQYMFYKQAPRSLPGFVFPEIGADDVLQFGSYYALNPFIREKIRSLFCYAKEQGAILYYDLNFRSSYVSRIGELLPTINDNFGLADIVRGSADDFELLFGQRDAQVIYKQHIAPYCPLFICTCGGEDIFVCTPDVTLRHAAPHIEPVSTIGAGDNFNAGFIYGLICCGVGQRDLAKLGKEQWQRLLDYGCRFSAHVCQSIHNSIDEDFGRVLSEELRSAAEGRHSA